MEVASFSIALCASFAYAATISTRAFAVWLYFWGGCFCTAAATIVAWYRGPKIDFTLPDAAFDVLDTVLGPLKLSGTRSGLPYHRFADGYSMALLLGTLGLLRLRRDYVHLRRLLTLYGTVLYLRSLLLPLTSFPDPYPRCQTLLPGTRAWSDIPWASLPYEALQAFTANAAKESMSCGDMMFSGHTTMLVSCALTWHAALPRSRALLNLPKLAAHAYAAVGVLLLLFFRMHYSIDVVTAALVTFVCWNYQAYLCECASRDCLRQPFKHVFVLDGTLLFPAVRWLEKQ